MTSTVSKKMDDLLRASRNRECLHIGVGGGTGSGKSTVCELIRSRLAMSLSVAVVLLDRFLRPVDQLPTYYSEYHKAEQPDFNTPDSLIFEDMIRHCQQISGTEVVILDGHFALYHPDMRELMDIKCYVSCDLTEMLERRTRRNLAVGYGGDRENILAYNRECVTPRHQQFIQPTSRFADIVIPNGENDTQDRDMLLGILCEKISKSLLHGSDEGMPSSER